MTAGLVSLLAASLLASPAHGWTPAHARHVLSSQAFDVTDQVLQKLDEQMPALTVNFVAPVPPPAPTAAAQPSAAPASSKSKKK